MASSTAWADAYEKGLEAYKDGEYSKAVKVLSKASKKAKDKFDKASMLVLMGASSVKLGKNSKAKEFFTKALKLDPQVQLATVAAKDRKVKKVFSSAQKDSASDGGFGDEDAEFGAFNEKESKAKKTDNSSHSSNNKSTRESDDQAPVYSYFFPLGLNEAYQGRYLQAIATGLGQGSLFVVFFLFNQAADSADKDASAAFQNAQSRNQTNDPNLLKFLNENEKYVKDKRQYAQFALLGSVAFYGLSVADSAFHWFGSNSAPAKSPNRSKGRRGASLYLLPPDTSLTSADENELRPFTAAVPWSYDFSLLPTQKPELFFSFNKNF